MNADEVDKRLVDGYYWLDFGGRLVIAERSTTRSEDREGAGDRVEWNTCGSDDYFLGDNSVRVVAGPIAPPETSTR